MALAKIQTGDQVKVIAGNYRNTVGQVVKVVRTKKGKLTRTRVAISTVPKITKYRKSMSYEGQNYPGTMFQVDRLIDVSNVAHVTEDGLISKVVVTVNKDGKKTRTYKKNSAVIERKKLPKVETTEITNS